jgi:hypothetical protein
MQDAGLGGVMAGSVLVYHMVCRVYFRNNHAICIGVCERCDGGQEA